MISKWWSKDERALAPRLKFCLNPAEIACWYWYQYVWYRYQKCTGTRKCGTNTKSVLVLHCLGVPVPVYWVPVPLPHCMWVPVPLPHCMWVPVPVSVVPVPLPLQIAPLHCNTTQGPSIAVVINNDDLHLFSRIKPLQNLCAGLEKPAHA